MGNLFILKLTNLFDDYRYRDLLVGWSIFNFDLLSTNDTSCKNITSTLIHEILDALITTLVVAEVDTPRAQPFQESDKAYYTWGTSLSFLLKCMIPFIGETFGCHKSPSLDSRSQCLTSKYDFLHIWDVLSRSWIIFTFVNTTWTIFWSYELCFIIFKLPSQWTTTFSIYGLEWSHMNTFLIL